MKIAVVGCCHGSLDEIYSTISQMETDQNIKISLLLICGDFQALRNPADLECLAVPPKYRAMGSFHRYYSEKSTAPLLTIFIGGNHESSGFLQELPFGGWVAPNIYFLGLAGVVRVSGLRIAGWSGIFKPGDFGRGHFEVLPFNESEKRSIYHTRSLEHFRLRLLKSNSVDILMTHDWPRGITNFGNLEELLRRKPFFRQDIQNGVLGSPPAEDLLFSLKPKHYFSGHLHCRFTAIVKHDQKSGMVAYGVTSGGGANSTESDGVSSESTAFLALDKVLPHRRYLEVVDVSSPEWKEEDGPPQLELDPEWLMILKTTAVLWSYGTGFCQLPTKPETVEAFKPTSEQLEKLSEDFGDDFRIPENFEPTAPVYAEGVDTKPNWRKFSEVAGRYFPPIRHYLNSQSALICQMLEIDNPNVEWGRRAARRGIEIIEQIKSDGDTEAVGEEAKNAENITTEGNPDEITFSFDEADEEDEVSAENGEELAVKRPKVEATSGAD